jgi:hypothetical protein
MASRFSQLPPPAAVAVTEPPVLGGGGVAGEDGPETSMPYLPQSVVLCESRHGGFEDGAQMQSGPSDEGLVSKWRLKDRVSKSHGSFLPFLNTM